MRMRAWHGIIGLALLSLWIKVGALPAARAEAKADLVTLWRVPEKGIQPQAAVDSRGVVHLVYFRGKPEAGDLYYLRMTPGQKALSAPIRVNSQPGSVTAIGTIRCEQIAIGQGDRIHVVWNGVGKAGANGYPGLYMAYTRLNDQGTAFEPQRNLSTWAGGLDGGGSVAADKAGNVYVVWHAGPPGSKAGEAGRAVFLTHSRDNGKTFPRERQINPQPTGACGCCGMRAFVDHNGVLSILYRAAGENVRRDTMLLLSRDRGATFQERLVDRWNLNACPMSSFALSEGEGSILAAWETQNRVYYGQISPASGSISKPIVAPGAVQSKHPVILANAQGQTLFAWTEGTGWNRGGSLAWQVYDREGRPVGSRGAAEGVPAWSLLTAYTRPDGSFVLIY
ncbi:MAG TPA: hypothetical protein VFB38_17750 [Chthonomonadaceae bacterium]|nr:hypothetical protein [Chthonomonadaceae bacterium]